MGRTNSPVRSRSVWWSAAAAVAVAGVALSGCAPAAAEDVMENGDPREIEIAVFTGWPEGIAVSELWRAALEGEGYEVTLTTVSAAPAYLGLAEGDYGLVLDSWLPAPHQVYRDAYGNLLENLGVWDSEARGTRHAERAARIASL